MNLSDIEPPQLLPEPATSEAPFRATLTRMSWLIEQAIWDGETGEWFWGWVGEYDPTLPLPTLCEQLNIDPEHVNVYKEIL